MIRAGAVAGLALFGTALQAASAAAQPAEANKVVCQEPEQQFRFQGDAMNARQLDFLLFDAADKGCAALVERLLASGASVAARDRFGNTALLHAARMGHDAIVRFLLDQGADVQQANLGGSTALLRAVDMNRRSTARILLQADAAVNAVNDKGLTPLIIASYNGNAKLVALLLRHGADPKAVDRTGKGAIVYAAGKGFADITEQLLDAGVAVDTVYGNGLTALMWAAGHANDVPEAEGVQTVQLLLDRGARHDLADDRGRTPLMIGAERGHAGVVALLLGLGADPARRDKGGRTALDLAHNDAVRAALAE